MTKTTISKQSNWLADTFWLWQKQLSQSGLILLANTFWLWQKQISQNGLMWLANTLWLWQKQLSLHMWIVVKTAISPSYDGISNYLDFTFMTIVFFMLLHFPWNKNLIYLQTYEKKLFSEDSKTSLGSPEKVVYFEIHS